MAHRFDAIESSRPDGSVPSVTLVVPGALAAMVLLGFSLVGGILRGLHGIWIALLGMSGIAFAGAILVLLPGILAERRVADRLSRREPDRPWMWRADWAAGRALGASQSAVNERWALALLLNSVLAPFLFTSPGLAREEGVVIGAGAFLVGLVGVAMVLRAVRASVRFARFGATTLELDAVPVPLGGELRGTIRVRFPMRPGTPVAVKLTCVNRVVAGFGRYSWIRKVALWSDERAIAPETVLTGPFGATIPVRVEVPAGQPPTRLDHEDALVWLLEVEAALPGMDYHERFEVPVFAAGAAQASRVSAVAHPPSHRTLDVRSTPAGRLEEVTFPAGRSASVALFATVLWTCWLAVYLFGGVPAFLVPFSVIVGIGFFALTLWLWLGRSSVSVGHGAVTVRHSMLGVGRTSRVPVTDIRSVSMERSGAPGGAAFYRIVLVRRDGRALTVGAGLRDKREAEWVVAELSRALGVRGA